MTDYRFVSRPDVTLNADTSDGVEPWYRHPELAGDGMTDDDIRFMLDLGIIEPVPVEIPEHVLEAACSAFRDVFGMAYTETFDLGVRAALIAAKQAEEAGA